MAKPIIWTIASSDSGGGAGIQADLHTIHALGGHGCSVISAVTAQNSLSVLHIEPVSDKSFSVQLSALAEDISATVIKIGLIATVSHVEILADFLQRYKQSNPTVSVIYDPVVMSSTGADMTEAGLIDTVKTQLLPYIDVLTPNQNELALLSGVNFADNHGQLSSSQLFTATKNAIQVLQDLGVKGVCAKGGHADFVDAQQPIALDVYIDAQREVILSSPRLAVTNNHGTGCTFAAALATVIGQDYPVDDALVVAKAYLNQALKQGYALGSGSGVLGHQHWPTDRCDFPQVVLANTPLGDQLGLAQQMQLAYDFAPCDTNRLGLYPVVDTVEWLDKVLQQGVKTLQLRIKDKTPAQVVDDIKLAVALGRQYQARLFINDYWQLAIEHGAYGVHLGQEDMLIADFAAIKQAGLKLGLSTHGYYEILRAHQIKPSYIALGHIYPTVTKDMPSKPQGLVRLQRYADLMQDYPLVAIGGISIKRAPQVVATGVGSVAVVTAITRADDYKQAIAELMAIAEPQASLANIGS